MPVFRKLMTSLGGRTFLLVAGFCFVAMSNATALLWRPDFTAEHWVSALKITAGLIAIMIGKRAAEEIGASFGRNDKPPHQPKK